MRQEIREALNRISLDMDVNKCVEDMPVTKHFLDHHMKYSYTMEDGKAVYIFNGNHYIFEQEYDPIIRTMMYDLCYKRIHTEDTGWVSNDYKRTVRKL